MRPRGSKGRDLMAIAGAVVGSAAAVQVVMQDECPSPEGGKCMHPLTSEQNENTYSAVGLWPGVWVEDERTHSVVGTNGRRILVREDADGLYVGGVLLATAEAVSDLAMLLVQQSNKMATREQS